ncbi:MAG: WecB/TagA/CpsF family glycosyltransferase, partial [Acidobacteriota bacterium]
MIDLSSEPFAVLGVQLNSFRSYHEATEMIRQRIRARRPTFCVAINPEKVYRSARDAKLKNAIDRADVRICDGIGVAIAALLLEHRRLPRCTGIELFTRLIPVAAQEGWRIFLLGASPESNAAACRKLRAKYPELRIAGSQHGFFEHPTAVVDKINQSGAELLFVAMGSPRQEFWITENLSRLKPCLCMGIGGSLDVISGAATRAPALFSMTGTEWLYRLIAQPSRLQRQRVLPLFVLDVLKAMLSSRGPVPIDHSVQGRRTESESQVPLAAEADEAASVFQFPA